MYSDLIKPQSFIATNGYIFNSPDTIEDNVKKIENKEPITIITVTDERTWFRDIVETKFYVYWSYGIGSKAESDITVLEDGKELAEKRAEEQRKLAEEQEANRAEQVEQETLPANE